MPRWTKPDIKALGHALKELTEAKRHISKVWGLLEGAEMNAESLESDGFAPILDTYALSDCRDSLTFIEETVDKAIRTAHARLRKIKTT